MVIQWRITEDTEGITGPDAMDITGARGGDMVSVRVSEIYDMCTVKNKVGVIGIHTPNASTIEGKWRGFFLNHRYFKIGKCDVSLACASMLPLDPLGIGTEAGKVAPQDMMNPILYRAVSNDAWNLMVGRLYSVGVTGGDTVDLDRNSIRALSDAFTGSPSADQEKLYYSLLAENEWRKAMPQQGLNMTGLVPMCYPVVSTIGHGEVASGLATTVATSAIATGSTGLVTTTQASTSNPNSLRLFKGPAMPLPRLTCNPQGITINESADSTVVDSYAGSVASVPRIYVGCIVMPPARLTNIYYRLKVTWTVEFMEPVSILDKRNLSDAITGSDMYYGRTYDFTPSSKLEEADSTAIDTNTIDTLGLTPDLVMDV